MKKNKTITPFDKSMYAQENYPLTNNDNSMYGDGLWMEFEDSFIEILSGAEPFSKYFNAAEIQQYLLA